MSAAEFEQLASEIRPAWEVGLDAVGEGSAIVAAVPTNGAVTAGAFSAPTGNMASMLGALGGPSLKATFTGVMPVEMPVSPVREQPLPSVMVSAEVSSGAPGVASPETTAALPLARPSGAPAQTSGPLASTPPGAAAPWEKTGRFAAVGGQSLAPPRSTSSGGGLPIWAVGVAVIGLLVAIVGGGMALRARLNPDDGAQEPSTQESSASASAPTASQELPSAAGLPLPTPLPGLSAMPTAEPSVPAVVPTGEPTILAPIASAAPTAAALPMIPPPPVPSVPAAASAQEPVAPPPRPVVTAQPTAVARPNPPEPRVERPATPRPPRVQRPPRRPSGVGFTTESPY